MAVISRTTGALMLAYAALYTAHFVFDALYDAGPVWIVFNVISAAGIVIALPANFAHVRAPAGSGPDIVARFGAHALFYANAALAIWFLRNWVHQTGQNRELSHCASGSPRRSGLCWQLGAASTQPVRSIPRCARRCATKQDLRLPLGHRVRAGHPVADAGLGEEVPGVGCLLARLTARGGWGASADYLIQVEPELRSRPARWCRSAPP